MNSDNKKRFFASDEELVAYYEKKTYGASFNEIIDAEANKLGITAEEFLASDLTRDRRIEVGKMLEILKKPFKDKSPGTINAGSFGLGRRKS